MLNVPSTRLSFAFRANTNAPFLQVLRDRSCSQITLEDQSSQASAETTERASVHNRGVREGRRSWSGIKSTECPPTRSNGNLSRVDLYVYDLAVYDPISDFSSSLPSLVPPGWSPQLACHGVSSMSDMPSNITSMLAPLCTVFRASLIACNRTDVAVSPESLCPFTGSL